MAPAAGETCARAFVEIELELYDAAALDARGYRAPGPAAKGLNMSEQIPTRALVLAMRAAALALLAAITVVPAAYPQMKTE